MEFILSQEVTSHIRAKACKFQETTGSSECSWKCSQCLFTTDSQAECFFHEVLHDPPLTEVKKTGDAEKVVQKYTCPICPKSFRKASLRQHLRQHTFERPFVCSICKANFTRLTSLTNHVRHDHGDRSQKPKPTTALAGFEEWSCKKCLQVFPDK